MIRCQRVKRLANWKLETCIPPTKVRLEDEAKPRPTQPTGPTRATSYSVQVSCLKEKENSSFPYRHYR